MITAGSVWEGATLLQQELAQRTKGEVNTWSMVTTWDRARQRQTEKFNLTQHLPLYNTECYLFIFEPLKKFVIIHISC